MRVRQVMGVAGAISLLGQSVQAAPPTTPAEAIAQFNSDATLLSGWLNDQFIRAVPNNMNSGNVVPSQIKLFGFEVGAEAVVSSSKIDRDGFHALPTQIIDTTQINTESKFPMPLILGHAKIGLPMGFDAGIRVGGIPKQSRNNGTTHIEAANALFGLDVRKVLIEEGVVKPFGLTVGASYTHAGGHAMETTPLNSLTGSNVTFGSDAATSARSDWRSKSAGLQALVNKKILFMEPYIGGAVNKNWGTMDSSIANTGSFTVGASPSQSLEGTGGTASRKINSWDLRGLLGIEFTFLPFMKLDLGGEFASEGNVAGSIGLRVQFH
jgi:hypothetical protein